MLRALLARPLIALGIGVSLGCGSGSTSTPPPPAAQVERIVFGNPVLAPQLEGATVDLQPKAVDATGQTVTGAVITWSSSDSSIATVSSGGVIHCIGLGSVTISASSATADAYVQFTIRAGSSITTAGGVVAELNGAARLTVPAGALAQTQTIYIDAPLAIPADTRLVLGTAFTIATQPSGSFGASQLEIRYDPAKLPAAVTESSLQLYQLGASWTLVPQSRVTVATHTVFGTITTPGTYAIIGTAVDHVTIDGNSATALIVGQTRALGATSYDAANTALPDRVVTWQSSDQSRATVSATGVVTAVAAGTATITATVEGKSASTLVTVNANVVADWSQATEWTTFQGDGAHTGYMAATIDPTALALLGENHIGGAETLDLSYTIAATPMIFFTTDGTSTVKSKVNTSYLRGASITDQFYSELELSSALTGPTLANGRVYVVMTLPTGSRFLSLYNHGFSHSSAELTGKTVTYPAPVATAQAVYIACGNPVGVCAMDPITSERKWFAATNPSDRWAPAIANNVVYAYTGLPSPKVQAFDPATGQQLYEIADAHFVGTSATMDVTPAIGANNDLLVTQGGRLLSFDLTGRKVGWEIAGSFAGPVTVANGVVYARNNGKVEARKESDGTLLWTWTAPSGVVTNSMIATKNLLFVSSSSSIYAIDLATQATVFAYAGTGRLSISAQGFLLVSATGYFTQIKAK